MKLEGNQRATFCSSKERGKCVVLSSSSTPKDVVSYFATDMPVEGDELTPLFKERSRETLAKLANIDGSCSIATGTSHVFSFWVLQELIFFLSLLWILWWML